MAVKSGVLSRLKVTSRMLYGTMYIEKFLTVVGESLLDH